MLNTIKQFTAMSRFATSSINRYTGRLLSSSTGSSTVAIRRLAPTTSSLPSNHHNHSISILSPSPQIIRQYHARGSNIISSHLIHHTSKLRPIDDNITYRRTLQILNTSCVGNIISSQQSFAIRGISSTHQLLDDADAKPAVKEDSKEGSEVKKEGTAVEEDDDPCPAWQNPLHHNNPDYQKVLAEDFEPGEEMPVVPLPPFEEEGNEDKVLASPELHALADEVVRLNMLEVAELVDRIGSHFGLEDGDGFDGDDGDGGGDDAAEEEAAEEKTVFDLKLTGFDSKSKIKVIKEIRGVTTLGLKEAKELVEGAPVSSYMLLLCMCYV